MTVINGSMTLDQVQAELLKHDVADLDVSLFALSERARASATLGVSAGPEGRAHVPNQGGATLAEALNKLCECADELITTGVRVFDHTGRLRGRYTATPEGYSLAEKHMRSLGRGASVASPGK